MHGQQNIKKLDYFCLHLTFKPLFLLHPLLKAQIWNIGWLFRYSTGFSDFIPCLYQPQAH